MAHRESVSGRIASDHAAIVRLSDTVIPDDPMPLPPEKPSPAECCEGGCDRCVFDLYAEALEHYRLALREWQARQGA